MAEFDFLLRTRVIFGDGAVDRLGSLAAELSARRAFLVTDPAVAAAGHTQRAADVLRAAGLAVRIFDEVSANPSSVEVAACRAALGDWNAGVIVGVGGGSSIDVAKGCNFVRAGGGRMEDYWGEGKAKGTLLPLIAVPTTAGTGTEVQSFALIEEEGTHQKMACGDAQATPAIALLDPTLTVSQPEFVTACTGMDTIGHAVETAVTKKRNAVSNLFSTAAFKLAHANLPKVLEKPGDLLARGCMLKASAFAGIAIENSMLGAAHSMANPLGAHYDIAHGQAVGLTLPHVVQFNAEDAEAAECYAELVRCAGLCSMDTPVEEAVVFLVERLRSLIETTGIGPNLGALRVPPTNAGELAEEAAKQWTAQFNPRAIDADGFRDLFLAATN